MRPRAILVCAVAWLACGPVDGPPSAYVPVNACPDNPCGAYVEPSPLVPAVCSGGACVSNSPIDFVFVVSLPESSFFAPGVTMALPYSQLLAGAPTTASCEPPACVELPPLAEDTGSLIVSLGVATAAGEDLGNGGNTSIPVQVQYFPQWPFPTPTATSAPVTFVDAPAAGLPLLATHGTISASPGNVPGPNHTLGRAWNAALAPGAYERDVVPYDDAFPPEVRVISTFALDESDTQSGVDGLGYRDARNTHQLTVTSVASKGFAPVDVTGFSAYLRDATTLRRVSARATFTSSTPPPVYLNTYTNIPLSGVRKLEVVIEPPAGWAFPTFSDPIVTGVTVLATETFPALPTPVNVSGVVQAPDGTPVEADLVIENAAATGASGSIIASDGSHLHFATSAHAGTNGSYAVTLPPGTYDVRVIPVLGANGAANDTSLTIAEQPQNPAPVAAGQTLIAALPGVIQGVARIADGRPLAGATVSALPSASLAPTTDSRRWPRTQTATTAADGSFTLRVDPGIYDVLVEPAGGTSLPVVTASSQTVAAAGTVVLGPMVVPAPIAIDLTLHDPFDNAVVGADVRAFAVAASFVAPAGGGPAPSLEIGHFTTDATGHLQLLVVPPR